MTQAWYTAVFNAQTKTGKLEDLHKIINKIDFTGKNKNKTVNNLDQFKLLAHKYGLNTPWNNYSKGG